MAVMSEENIGSGNGADGPGPRDWEGPGGLEPGGLGGGKRLERKVQGRWLAGICAGLAAYLGVDVNLIRVVFAVAVLFGGFGALAYILAWALVPEEGEPVSIAEKVINKSGT